MMHSYFFTPWIKEITTKGASFIKVKEDEAFVRS